MVVVDERSGDIMEGEDNDKEGEKKLGDVGVLKKHGEI